MVQCNFPNRIVSKACKKVMHLSTVNVPFTERNQV